MDKLDKLKNWKRFVNKYDRHLWENRKRTWNEPRRWNQRKHYTDLLRKSEVRIKLNKWKYNMDPDIIFDDDVRGWTGW